MPSWIMLLWSAAWASGSCENFEITYDPFTKERSSHSSGPYIMMPGSLKWEVILSGSKVNLKLHLLSAGVRSEVLPVGFPVKVLLGDGSVVELSTLEDTNPAPNATADAVYTAWIVTLPVTKDQATRIAALGAEAVRASLPTGDVTWELNDSEPSKEPKLILACLCLPIWVIRKAQSSSGFQSFAPALGCYSTLMED